MVLKTLPLIWMIKPGQKEQKDTTDITTARSDNNLRQIRQQEYSATPKPAETLKEPNKQETDLKSALPAGKVTPVVGTARIYQANFILTLVVVWSGSERVLYQYCVASYFSGQ